MSCLTAIYYVKIGLTECDKDFDRIQPGTQRPDSWPSIPRPPDHVYLSVPKTCATWPDAPLAIG
jgi:hypothetical protein